MYANNCFMRIACLGAFALSLTAATLTPTITETGGLNTPLRNAARSYQAVYFPSILPSAGSPLLLNSIQFRLVSALNDASGGSNWPPADINFADYTIYLSRPSDQLVTDGGYLSSTSAFSFGQAINNTLVRSGALTISAGSFLGNPSSTPAAPNAWGAVINFDTNYLYTPGEGLVLSIFHSGAAGGAATVFFSSADISKGFADAISNTSGSFPNGSGSGFSSPLAVQFGVVESIPEPTTMLLSGGALLGLAYLRRRRA